MAVVIDEMDSIVEPEIPRAGAEEAAQPGPPELKKTAEDFGAIVRHMTKRQIRLRAD
jgi:hypothetical protein